MKTRPAFSVCAWIFMAPADLGKTVYIGIIILCRTSKIEIMCNLHKFVKSCKKMEKTLIQVIHIKKQEKGGKIEVFENLSTLSTSKSTNLVDYLW